MDFYCVLSIQDTPNEEKKEIILNIGGSLLCSLSKQFLCIYTIRFAMFSR